MSNDCNQRSSDDGTENVAVAVAATDNAEGTEQSHGVSVQGQARTPMTHTERWEDAFRRLKAFRKMHGHCEVPFRYTRDTRLGRWVAFQRTLYRRMKDGEAEPASLTPDRMRRLEEIGFEWSVKAPKQTQWDTHFDELVEFKERFHHFRVPVAWQENPELAEWVKVQRREAKHFREGRESKIKQSQISKLNKIGFDWVDTSSEHDDTESLREVTPRIAELSLQAVPSGLDRPTVAVGNSLLYDPAGQSMAGPSLGGFPYYLNGQPLAPTHMLQRPAMSTSFQQNPRFDIVGASLPTRTILVGHDYSHPSLGPLVTLSSRSQAVANVPFRAVYPGAYLAAVAGSPAFETLRSQVALFPQGFSAAATAGRPRPSLQCLADSRYAAMVFAPNLASTPAESAALGALAELVSSSGAHGNQRPPQPLTEAGRYHQSLPVRSDAGGWNARQDAYMDDDGEKGSGGVA